MQALIERFPAIPKPAPAAMQALFKPVADQLMAAQEGATGPRGSWANHQKAVAESIQAFAWLAYSGPDLGVFTAAMAIDNVSGGFAGTALIAYMSSLTSIGYTATQYALLSSFYAFPGKVLKGFTGVAIESLETGRTLLEAYALFFAGTALVGIPAVILCVVLMRQQRSLVARPLPA